MHSFAQAMHSSLCATGLCQCSCVAFGLESKTPARVFLVRMYLLEANKQFGAAF
jgi:hypothetical protein